MAVIAPKWSPLQEVVCLFTYPKKWSKIISLQKGGKSNMILHTDFLYKYWGSNPIFLYKTAIFSALYGTQAPSKCRGNPNGDSHAMSSCMQLTTTCYRTWFFTLYATLCYTNTMLHYATLRYTMLHYATLCCTMLHYATLTTTTIDATIATTPLYTPPR